MGDYKRLQVGTATQQDRLITMQSGGNDSIWNLEKSPFIPARKKPEDYTIDYVQLQVFHKALFLKSCPQCSFPVP